MKLSEMKEKKSGDYYSVDDVLGEEITILEECNQNTNFREYVFKAKEGQDGKKNKPYACLLIRHTEEKDLHITNFAMVALSEVMPQNPAESWRGYRVRINKLGTGTNLKYKIAVVGKTLEAPPAPAPAPIVDSAGQVVGLLKHAPAGTEDAAFWKAAIAICGSMPAAMAVVEKLRVEGKIISLGGSWEAT